MQKYGPNFQFHTTHCRGSANHVSIYRRFFSATHVESAVRRPAFICRTEWGGRLWDSMSKRNTREHIEETTNGERNESEIGRRGQSNSEGHTNNKDIMCMDRSLGNQMEESAYNRMNEGMNEQIWSSDWTCDPTPAWHQPLFLEDLYERALSCNVQLSRPWAAGRYRLSIIEARYGLSVIAVHGGECTLVLSL